MDNGGVVGGEEWWRCAPKESAAPRGKYALRSCHNRRRRRKDEKRVEERFDRGWWVGEEWCPRDPKVSAVPRGKCRVLRRNATGLGIVEVRDRQVKGLSVRALRGKVRLSNRSGVTGKGKVI